MPSHIANVFKQALNTFTLKQSRPELFTANFQELIKLLDKTRSEHLNIPSCLYKTKFWEQPDKAPVTCIEIYEDSTISMSVFILKPYGSLPLHNHPQMYGLIKVIEGEVEIKSYTINTEKTQELDRIHLQMPRAHRNDVAVELDGDIRANADSSTCTLEPNLRNFHEIKSIGGPAAFLDILAPPYEYPLPECKNRYCAYYKKVRQLGLDIYQLQEIRSPSCYWTDSWQYTGPDVLDFDVS